MPQWLLQVKHKTSFFLFSSDFFFFYLNTIREYMYYLGPLQFTQAGPLLEKWLYFYCDNSCNQNDCNYRLLTVAILALEQSMLVFVVVRFQCYTIKCFISFPLATGGCTAPKTTRLVRLQRCHVRVSATRTMENQWLHAIGLHKGTLMHELVMSSPTGFCSCCCKRVF